MDTCVKILSEWKFEVVRPYIERGDTQAGYAMFMAISLGFGLISTCLVNFGETVRGLPCHERRLHQVV